MLRVLDWRREDDSLVVETSAGRLLLAIAAQAGENNFALQLVHGGGPVCYVLRDVADELTFRPARPGTEFLADTGVWRVTDGGGWELDPDSTVR